MSEGISCRKLSYRVVGAGQTVCVRLLSFCWMMELELYWVGS